MRDDNVLSANHYVQANSDAGIPRPMMIERCAQTTTDMAVHDDSDSVLFTLRPMQVLDIKLSWTFSEC